MSTKKSGGTAFPKTNEQTRGLTMRDYMAGQALTGYLSDDSVLIEGISDAHKIAKKCYMIADAMIAARGEEEGNLQEYLDDK